MVQRRAEHGQLFADRCVGRWRAVFGELAFAMLDVRSAKVQPDVVCIVRCEERKEIRTRIGRALGSLVLYIDISGRQHLSFVGAF